MFKRVCLFCKLVLIESEVKFRMRLKLLLQEQPSYKQFINYRNFINNSGDNQSYDLQLLKASPIFRKPVTSFQWQFYES